MSDSDSFIDEVTEEIRRERLYGYLRRYGWIGIVVVVLVVGGTAWTEWRKAQVEARAQALGDALLEAYAEEDDNARAAQLESIQVEAPSARAAVDLITATELAATGDPDAAAERLNALAVNGEVPEIYRRIAGFRALLVQTEALSPEERREGFGGFDVPGNPLRLLAAEQLALIDIETGATDAALERLQGILRDAEASPGLQERAAQVIVALGGEPETATALQPQN